MSTLCKCNYLLADMKQLKIILPIILFLVFAFILTSCYKKSDEWKRKELTSAGGVYLNFLNSKYVLVKVEFIGTGKMIINDPAAYAYNPNKCKITLNAGDTVSRFRIFYVDTEQPDSNQEGSVAISYNGKPIYRIDDYYGNDVVMVYDATISATTFKKVEITYSEYDVPTIEITP